MNPSIRQEFPALGNYTYLNTAASGLLSKKVAAFRREKNEEYLKNGSNFLFNNGTVYPETREALADFFGGEAGKIALLPSFSFGLNAILEGLPQNSKILLIDDEYPSINLAVEARDFSCSYVPVSAELEEAIYDKVGKENPDVAILSTVQYISGVKLSSEFTKKLKNDFPDLLIIGDGTQSCGMEGFDFSQSGYDIFGASAYKWLNAGFGNGFFMFREGVENRIAPKSLGFGSNIGPYKENGNPLIGKFEPAHPNIVCIGSMAAAIEFQREIGLEKIERQNRKLRKLAFDAFAERGLLSEAVSNRNEHSNLFNIKGNDALFEKLSKEKIICSQRGNGIRVSLHYYNTEEDLEKLLKVVDA